MWVLCRISSSSASGDAPAANVLTGGLVVECDTASLVSYLPSLVINSTLIDAFSFVVGQAVTLSDYMTICKPAFQCRDIEDVSLGDGICLDYIPPASRDDITPAFWEAYRCMIRSIYTICGNANQIPYPRVILGTANGMINLLPYIEKGAKADHALDCVMAFAKDQSPLGDSEFDNVMADVNMRPDDVWENLPRCDNDLEFALVRKQLRLTDNMGPYD